MAELCATAPNRSRKRPNAWGRITSRSYSSAVKRVGSLPAYTEKWFSQKSVMTSRSCRSLASARATRAARTSFTRRRADRDWDAEDTASTAGRGTRGQREGSDGEADHTTGGGGGHGDRLGGCWGSLCWMKVLGGGVGHEQRNPER